METTNNFIFYGLLFGPDQTTAFPKSGFGAIDTKIHARDNEINSFQNISGLLMMKHGCDLRQNSHQLFGDSFSSLKTASFRSQNKTEIPFTSVINGYTFRMVLKNWMEALRTVEALSARRPTINGRTVPKRVSGNFSLSAKFTHNCNTFERTKAFLSCR